jgi:hypothetical protein
MNSQRMVSIVTVGGDGARRARAAVRRLEDLRSADARGQSGSEKLVLSILLFFGGLEP